MALQLINYKPIGFSDTNLPTSLYIDDNGLITRDKPKTFEIVNCNNAYLSSGWTDLHVHIWHGGSDISIRADEAGFKPVSYTHLRAHET